MTQAARSALRALAAGAVSAALFVACTLDWKVRSDDGFDATTSADARTDAPVAPTDSAVDVTVETGADASDCAALRADVDAKLKLARVCTLQVGECQQTVKDECDCDVVVTQPTAKASLDYEAAVEAFVAGGCVSGCTACPSTTGRNCLVKGTKTECYPPQ